MPARAPSSPTYTWRLAALSLLLLAAGAYFLYDGYYTYPRDRDIHEAFLGFERDGRTEDWNEFAAERGYPLLAAGDDRPGKPRSDTDIQTQKVIGYALLPLGLLLGAWWARYRRRWIASDESGLSTSWGRRVPFEAITSLNKELWRKKGIAVVYYREEGGSERRLVLDDWKYERQATTTMVQEVESRLPADKVIGPPSAAEPPAPRMGEDESPRRDPPV